MPQGAAGAAQQPVVNLQQLQAQLAKVQPQLLTAAANQQLPLTLPQQQKQAKTTVQLMGAQAKSLAEPQQGQLDARHQQELQQQLTQVSRQVKRST